MSSRSSTPGTGTSETRKPEVLATYVVVGDRSLSVTLSDGRRLEVPIDWYPRLSHGTPAERNNWQLVGDGVGIHWPDLDEDLSVEGFLEGSRSGESRQSIRRWLHNRARGIKPTEFELSAEARRTLDEMLDDERKLGSRERISRKPRRSDRRALAGSRTR